MMLKEFEELTGFYPTREHYAAIEAAYTEFGGDKATFCEAYKANKDGMAEAIARKVTVERVVADQKAEDDTARRIEYLEDKIEHLERELKKEQEWRPYECKENVKQSDYEKLAAESLTREMPDEEAADLIAEEFSFNRERIKIVHDVPKQEINRHNRVRKVGTYERKALFFNWDWNYIRFDVVGNTAMSYELNDGTLQLFYS